MGMPLTVDKAAKLLRLNRKTLYEQLIRLEQPAWAIRFGRTIRVSRDALDCNGATISRILQGRVVHQLCNQPEASGELFRRQADHRPQPLLLPIRKNVDDLSCLMELLHSAPVRGVEQLRVRADEDLFERLG